MFKKLTNRLLDALASRLQVVSGPAGPQGPCGADGRDAPALSGTELRALLCEALDPQRAGSQERLRMAICRATDKQNHSHDPVAVVLYGNIFRELIDAAKAVMGEQGCVYHYRVETNDVQVVRISDDANGPIECREVWH